MKQISEVFLRPLPYTLEVSKHTGVGGLGGLPAGTFFENDPLANAHEIQGTGGAW